MPSATAQFDLSTAFLDQPKALAYGLVRGAGNRVLQHELVDKTRVVFQLLGEGMWDSPRALWINSKPVALPSVNVHFHPGGDGEIGSELAATSTGGDQRVDSFFTSLPVTLDPITFSRFAWIALKVPPDPGAPSADLTVLGDYQAMRVRQFDAAGNQTAFAWTQNWAWIICDYLIRKFVLREAKVNQPLVAAEMARFDWPSFADSAAYYDGDIGGGIKRFSDGGAVFLSDSQNADKVFEQMLLMCRSYLLERNGKFVLNADKPRASVFTFNIDNVAPNSFRMSKSNLRGATNRLYPKFRDYNLPVGSADDSARFAIASSPKVDHEAHQRTVGVRGPGLSVIPKVTDQTLDLGVNTPERAWRILKGLLTRQLGDDVDANTAYTAPFSAQWTGYEDSDAVEMGNVVKIDASLSEEFGGKQIEVLEILEKADGTREFSGLEYIDKAFPEAAPPQQTLQAPVPGNGLATPFVLSPSNQLQVDPSTDTVAKKGSIPPAFAPGLTYTSTPSAITWNWDFRAPNQIYRTNSAITPLTPNNSQVVNGLAAATTYRFHPFYDEAISDVNMLVAGGVGIPAWAHTVATRAKIAEMYRQDHIPLATASIVASTVASGTGGGSGGGDGGCLRVGMFVRERSRGIIRCEKLRIGDYIWGERDVWLKVVRMRIAAHQQWVILRCNNSCENVSFTDIERAKHVRPFRKAIHFCRLWTLLLQLLWILRIANAPRGLAVTTGHPFTLADGSMCRAANLTLESEIPCPSGVAFPVSIQYERRESKKVSITCEAPHTFYASGDGKSWLLTHNIQHTI